MQDETTFTENPETSSGPVQPVGTTQQKVTTETISQGPTRASEAMSGRFWITLVMAIGMVGVMFMLVISLIFGKFPTDATTVTALVGLAGGFLTTGAGVVGTYIGQHQKPNSE